MSASQAMETVALRCCWGGGKSKSGRACVQGALLLSNQNHACHGDKSGEKDNVVFATTTEAVSYSGSDGGDSKAATCDRSAVSAATGCSFAEVGGDGVGTDTTHSQGREALVGLATRGNCAEGTKSVRRGHAEWEREGTEIGATSFALRVADSYSRDDSRTIVRRAGAARVAASALSLLRALLTDRGQRRQTGGGVETGSQRDAKTEDDEDEESLACCVQQFCDEQVRSWAYRADCLFCAEAILSTDSGLVMLVYKSFAF